MQTMTVSFSQKHSARSAYKYLRNCCYRAEAEYNYNRGDHRLHILIPATASAETIRRDLDSCGYRYSYMGIDSVSD